MIPAGLSELFVGFADAGGRALLVGGTVRDALLGRPSKDLDIEVHGLTLEQVVPVLRRFGHVNEVGRAFGVLKLRWRGTELDVSLPRRDTRAGPGHKGIQATADPHLGIVEAARRRDLTLNAIAWDPLTGAYEDPFGGREDLARGLLRAVDPTTFGEDPLRALRVAQFAARFGFAVDDALAGLCAEMPLSELPAERIRGEVEKLLIKGKHLRAGWEFAQRTGQWAKVLPEWDAFPDALERAAAAPVEHEQRRLSLLYAAACDRCTAEETVAILDRLRVHRVGGFPVRRVALSLHERRAAAAGPLDDAGVRRLGEDADLDLLAVLSDAPGLLAHADRVGVRNAPLPALLTGAEMQALGVRPGPEMGRIMAEIRAMQLDGLIREPHEARHEVLRRVEAARSP